MHVVVVGNAIQSSLLAHYFKSLDIPKSEVIAVKLRAVDVSEYAGSAWELNDSRIARIIWRIFGISVVTLRLQFSLWKKNKSFILYAPWHNEVTTVLYALGLCSDLIYVEEGDLSYWDHEVMFDTRSLSRAAKFRQRRGPAKKHLFEVSASRVICVSHECFPCFQSTKKIIVQDLKVKSSTSDISIHADSVVAVLPAAARLESIDLFSFLKAYLEVEPDIQYLKLHPSFTRHVNLRARLLSTLESLRWNPVILEEDFSLESVMAKQSLILIGLHSSLERYASHFGSTYKLVGRFLYLQEGR